MNDTKNTYNRRSFLKASVLSGGGMLLTVSWLSSFKSADKMEALNLPEQGATLNGYIQIMADNSVNSFAPTLNSDRM